MGHVHLKRQIQDKSTINVELSITSSKVSLKRLVMGHKKDATITLLFRSFLFMLNGTATGMVAFVIVNKSKILSVKLREKTIKGRALVEPV